jgi:DDE superfamily endonuclease
MPAHDLGALRFFRIALHDCFRRRADALFELVDALLAAESVGSLPHLSLQAAHRRRWGNLYDALAEGRLDVEALRATLAEYPAADNQPVYAVDLSVWPRCDAEASPERGYYYHPSRHSAGQPIVAGWAYQWLAQLSFARDSWTAPLDIR